MLRVVLADDEKKIVYLLQHLIDWEQMGFEIAGVANDGLQAIDLVSSLQPDLLVTDIRMPGCSGLDLIRRAKELCPGIHCIIISGYREFEYAQKALQYGVEDYLLKPLKKDELGNILMRLRNRLGEEEKIEYRRKKTDEKKQEIFLARLRRCALRGIPFCGAGEANDEYGFSFSEGTFFAAVIRPDISDAGGHAEGYRILLQHSLDIVRRQLDRISCEYGASVFREGVAAIVNCPDYNAVEIRQTLTRICKEIEQQRDLFWDISAGAYTGSRKDRLEDAADSMREAIWLCTDRLCTGRTVRDADTERIDPGRRYKMDVSLKKRFQEAAEYLDEQLFEDTLRDSFVELRAEKPVTGTMVEEWFREVLRAGTYGLDQAGKTDPYFEEDMLERFWYCRDVAEIRELLLDGIMETMQMLRDRREQQESRPILEAKKYIQQHYDRPLRLEDVSDVVGFNATYFSTIFKKETGQTFVDYLGQIRVEKAKELLVSGDYSVMDICELVGYRDLKYFSRLFKKVAGISPSDYRRLYR